MPGDVLRFGEDFELDRGAYELRRSGRALRLERIPMEILLLLVERQGQLVSRENIIEQVWGKDVHLDADNSINAAIWKIRQTLRDDPEKPVFVQTVTGKGYRFIAAVTEVASAGGQHNGARTVHGERAGVILESAAPSRVLIEQTQHTTPQSTVKKRSGWMKRVAVAVVALMAIAISLRWFAKPMPFRQTEITRLTTRGNVTLAALSPDGRYVAYVTNEVGALFEEHSKDTLWVKHIVTGNDVRVAPPTDEKYLGLTFSRDGDFLYAVKSDPKDTGPSLLYKIPVIGGTAKRLIADVDGKVALSPDGKQLAFLRHSEARNESALMVANEDGSAERQLAARRLPNSFTDVAWSPNGKTIATAFNPEAANRASPVEIPVQGGAERPLTQEQWAQVMDSEWVPDGRGLIVNTQEQDAARPQINYISYSHGEVRRITSDLNNYVGVSLSADSRVLATVQMEFPSDIWVAPMAALDSAKPITSNGHSSTPTWSPDGRILYSNYTGSATNVWVRELDGSKARQLTANTAGVNYSPQVSPDGRYIVFASATGSHIWRMDVDGHNATQLTNSPLDAFNYSDVSPDGKWVAYTKCCAEQGIWKVSIEGGAPVRLMDGDARNPAISPDGRWIAYSYRDSKATPTHGVAIVDLEGGHSAVHFDVATSWLRWDADGRSLLYTRNEGDVENIWRQPIAGGTPRQITHFSSDVIYDFDVSRDGKRLAMSRGRQTSDVVLIRDVR